MNYKILPIFPAGICNAATARIQRLATWLCLIQDFGWRTSHKPGISNFEISCCMLDQSETARQIAVVFRSVMASSIDCSSLFSINRNPLLEYAA
uniref:Uncharacterized protein n=1 Tax=Pyxicephalus adspersus TaxID=30357 RepID=A0AAV3A7B9_PYXAD|nr:TPA: hypothetical protein GDO54_016173 [Pyxicephalus adspersus]